MAGFPKIAIEDLAILQTGDLAAILRYRRIFSPHRIDEHTARRKNGLCLVWQPTYQFTQKSMSIFGWFLAGTYYIVEKSGGRRL